MTSRKPVPSVSDIMGSMANRVYILTQEVRGLKPHRDAICRDPIFRYLDKRVAELAAAISEFRPEKPTPELLRTATAEVVSEGGNDQD